MTCAKCNTPTATTALSVAHPRYPYPTMQFHVMDCTACGAVYATETQRQHNVEQLVTRCPFAACTCRTQTETCQ